MKKWLYLFFLIFPLISFAQENKPLNVDQAFQLSIHNVEKDKIILHWKIAPGYHLYRDRFIFLMENPKNATIGQIVLPPGEAKQDEILGKYQVYTKEFFLSIPINFSNAKSAILLVTYQGCADTDFCYPPVTKRLTININNGVALYSQDTKTAVSTQDKIINLLKEKNYLWICLAFIGFGLLLAFTPCVLPMIPILSGIILGQDKKLLTTRRAFLLSFSYVLGMSIMYGLAGILASLAGNHLSAMFQSPIVIITFSVIFVLLALSLFDVYHLRLPHKFQHSIIHLSNRQKSGSYIGAAIMGGLSVLIVSPCVTAPLVGVLTFIAQTGDIILGSIALFALGLGMGIPLLIIGTTEGKFLPRSGNWMHAIKASFGVLLLAVAICLLDRILPDHITLILWAALLIILAVYLGVGNNRSPQKNWEKFAKGCGIISLCYGIILLVGAAQGNSSLFTPLASNSTSNLQKIAFEGITTLNDINQSLAEARQQHKIVMLDFYADWCSACHKMDVNTFANPRVKKALHGIQVLRADVTANNTTNRTLQDRFNVIAPPTIIFFGPDGNEIKSLRIIGAMDPTEFLAHLENLKRRTAN